MVHLNRGLDRCVNFSIKPRIAASSRNSKWQGAEFREIFSPHSGKFEFFLGGENSGVCLDWPHAPMKVRYNGKKNFSIIDPHPILGLPNQESCGEWQGAARNLVLFIEKDFIEQIFHSSLPISFSPSTSWSTQIVEHFFKLIYLDVANKSIAGPTIGETIIVKILNHIFPDCNTSNNVETRSFSNIKLNIVRDLIQSELSSTLNLSVLAKAAGMSVRHFTRAFRSATGLSPHQYIMQQRLERARALIQRGNLTKAEIAERVGFASHAHMTTTFRKLLDRTPSHFGNKI